jgi:hypothetical protein|tara:strand:+ start:227 stop:517 length:291 start_codon:yes stop_codon:yes gene_type:complete
MKIIGVKLHTPTSTDLLALAAVSALFIFVTLGVVSSTEATIVEVAPYLLGAVTGSLAGACGCSILKYGFRGAIVAAGFCVSMAGLCALLIQLLDLE